MAAIALISSMVWFLFIALTVVVVVGTPTTELLESVDCLLRDCERYFPNADRNITQNIIVRLQVTIDSCSKKPGNTYTDLIKEVGVAGNYSIVHLYLLYQRIANGFSWNLKGRPTSVWYNFTASANHSSVYSNYSKTLLHLKRDTWWGLKISLSFSYCQLFICNTQYKNANSFERNCGAASVGDWLTRIGFINWGVDDWKFPL